jgi:perosamine synthetase
MRQPPIRVAEPVLDGNERRYVLDCLDSSWISSRGKYIEQFEGLVREFCGVGHAVATNNGTTALHLALAAQGIGPGDEVIVPTLTYIASVNAIRYCGATPVFVDSQNATMTLDPDHVERKITPRTRGIVSVPLFGHPVDWHKLADVAARHRLFVVEDAAEALGASYAGRMVGSWGTCATFSFFGNKIITTGEGGMIVTDDPQLAARLRLLRGQAVSPERCYWHNEVGYNYRMTNVAAAIGCGQMERIADHLARRQQVASWYFAHLNGHRDLFALPDQAPECHHCYWMYSIDIRDQLVDRDEVIAELAACGIETRPVFYPVHWMPPYAEPRGSYPVAEFQSSQGISLPTHGRLSQDDVAFVCQQLVRIVRTKLGQHEADAGKRRAA